MFQSKMFAVALIAIMCALSVEAQSNTAATCQTVNGMSNVNATLLAGDWYEEIRAPAKNVSCVHVHVDVVSGQTLNIKTMYSASQNGLLMDNNIQANVNISQVNANTGFNVSYSNANGANTTYKILSANYTSNVVLCGFTNISDPSTSFGIILTRTQIPNANWLMDLKSNASQILPGFNGSSVANITQSLSCHASSASTSVPVLATLFAALYALLKFVY
ncbi:uncharacterized protein LOC111674509 [Lucilia cuprina]|uniref:uncharacterized protein LOC111674509 n=1 Tax=Lucilia cuprina TaxID=7375 RepID=UPI001F068D63|nr:uncharacterized protein LOC111674509 [Lucilia cuprina]